jgi:hypothetical protein
MGGLFFGSSAEFVGNRFVIFCVAVWSLLVGESSSGDLSRLCCARSCRQTDGDSHHPSASVYSPWVGARVGSHALPYPPPRSRTSLATAANGMKHC